MGRWTEEEIQILKDAYGESQQEPINLDRLSHALGRHKSNICRKARSLGLTNQARYKIEGGMKKKPAKYATEQERRNAISVSMKTWIRINGHPRGATGLIHTPESREKMCQAIQAAWANTETGYHTEMLKQKRSDLMLERNFRREPGTTYSRGLGGKRADLDDVYFRSSWEANYARYLKWLVAQGEIVTWKYEPRRFIFEAIKLGTRSYTPDFQVFLSKENYQWHEVKGWMDPKSATRLKRMAKYFPDETIIVIDKEWFIQAKHTGLDGIIPYWEKIRDHL